MPRIFIISRAQAVVLAEELPPAQRRRLLSSKGPRRLRSSWRGRDRVNRGPEARSHRIPRKELGATSPCRPQ